MRRSGSPGAKRLGGRLGAPYLLPIALTLAAGAGLWLLRGRVASLGTSIAGPDTQIRQALANQTRAHLSDVYGFRSGGTVELWPVRFADVVTSVERDRATVVAMLDAEGRAVWRDQAAALSYLGRERFHMRPCSISLWCGEGDQFERLRGVLLLLFRRHDAFQQRDAESLARLVSRGYRDRGEDRAAVVRRVEEELRLAPRASARILAWQIRLDRESGEAGEDWEITPEGEAPRRLRARYALAREEGRWLIVGGL